LTDPHNSETSRRAARSFSIYVEAKQISEESRRAFFIARRQIVWSTVIAMHACPF
jgi:hypothetical protein